MSFILSLINFEAPESEPPVFRTVDDARDNEASTYVEAFKAVMESPSIRELEALITMGDRILTDRPDNLHLWNLNDMARETLAQLPGASTPEETRENRVLSKFTEWVVRSNSTLHHQSGFQTEGLFRVSAFKSKLDGLMEGKSTIESADAFVIVDALKKVSIELKISNIANLPAQETNRSKEDFVRDLRAMSGQQRTAYFALAFLARNIYMEREVNRMDAVALRGSMPGVPKDLDLADPGVIARLQLNDPSCYEYGLLDMLGLKSPAELETLLENLDEIHQSLPAMTSAEFLMPAIHTIQSAE